MLCNLNSVLCLDLINVNSYRVTSLFRNSTYNLTIVSTIVITITVIDLKCC